ncbi:MAG: SipW-dependent-type signal peptide-containing protein [Rhodococcus sp. (in: high G+C Gram-positive bacteria)]
MSIGIVLGLGAVGTLAAWSDTATATSGTFTTGRIDIKLGDPAVDNDPSAFTTTMKKVDLFPNDTRSANLIVSNSGSVGFTYSIQAAVTSTTGLGALLNSSVYLGSADGTNTGCSGALLSTVTGLSTPQIFSHQDRSITGQGTTLPLPPPVTENLCFVVKMVGATPSTPATGTITYTLTATSS